MQGITKGKGFTFNRNLHRVTKGKVSDFMCMEEQREKVSGVICMELQMERFQAGFAWNCKGRALWKNSLVFLIGYDGLLCCRIETESATHPQPATVSAKLGNKVSTAMGLIFSHIERQKDRGRERDGQRERGRDRE